MNQQEIEQWCRRNGWSRPHRNQQGLWLAYPPNQLAAFPIPVKKTTVGHTAIEICHSLILAIAILVVGILSLLLSPLFSAPLIGRYKRRRSQPETDKDYYNISDLR